MHEITSQIFKLILWELLLELYSLPLLLPSYQQLKKNTIDENNQNFLTHLIECSHTKIVKAERKKYMLQYTSTPF